MQHLVPRLPYKQQNITFPVRQSFRASQQNQMKLAIPLQKKYTKFFFTQEYLINENTTSWD